MATKTASDVLTQGTKVVATVALKGVPVGTTGKVIHVQGLSWIRYWVWFDNGLRVGTLDRAKLATAEEWDRKLSGAEAVPASAAVGAVTAGSAAPQDEAMASVGGVPANLIERSRLARERWATKTAG